MRIDRHNKKKVLAFVAAILAALPAVGLASGGEAHVEKANNDIHNEASLQRGAKNFVNYCLGCHTAKYVRYNRMAADIGLSEQQMIDNLMFTGDSPHQTMTNAMNPADAKKWFGVAPPDLSLIARSKGSDYVYTFLRSFYADPTRATGANNLALPGTAMPHVLAPLQGLQRPRFETTTGADGKETQHLAGLDPGALAGDMPAAAFDSFVRDTVAFLEYISEPHKAKRQALGVWVVLFLLMFTAFAWFLYKEYWKDVK